MNKYKGWKSAAALAAMAIPGTAALGDPGRPVAPFVGTYKGNYRCNDMNIDITIKVEIPKGQPANSQERKAVVKFKADRAERWGSYGGEVPHGTYRLSGTFMIQTWESDRRPAIEMREIDMRGLDAMFDRYPARIFGHLRPNGSIEGSISSVQCDAQFIADLD